MLRHWFWDLKPSGKGPDWYFDANFAPPDAPRLAELVRQHAAPDFVPDPRELEPPDGATLYALYHDAGTYKKMVTGQGESIWVYTCITVRDSRLEIEGGFGGVNRRAETNLIEVLARSPDLTLLNWSVNYGGQGYSGGTLAHGTSVAELLKYLGPVPLPPRPPDFARIEAELRRALRGWKARLLFKLDSFEAGEWMCRAVVLYKRDASDIVREQGSLNAFAGSSPHHDEINRVGRAVLRRCDVPGRVVRPLSDPSQVIGTLPGYPEIKLHKPLGFVLHFGYSMEMGFYDYEDEFPEG